MEIKLLPDTAGEFHPDAKKVFDGLAWVGMEKIQMPISFEGQRLSAEVSAHVNLKAGHSRGIHMSRLFTQATETLPSQNLNWATLEKLTQSFIQSQGGISDGALLAVKFELPLLKSALKSELKGWRLYPVEMEVIQTASGLERKLTVEILYSSTCPASMALSKELWKKAVSEDGVSHENFAGWLDAQQGMPGTPHAQRSRARVQVTLGECDFSAEDLIEGLESVLQTPVQTVVKRADEQEFAKLNGRNPLFCEDAARAVQSWLDTLSFVEGYQGRFEHLESLHAHNAVASILKNRPKANC